MELMPFEALYPEQTRFTEIEKILGFIKAGNSCQVVGLPGVGRGNMLGFLAYNHAIKVKHVGEDQHKWLHFVLINFSEVKNKPLFDITKLMFFTLVESLKARKMDDAYEKAKDMFKESIGYHDELLLFQGLKQTIDFMAIEEQLTIVFLFERFETYVPMLTADFFTNLRILRSRAKYRFSVVLSLNRPLEDLINPEMMADFYEFLAGHIVYLPITDEPGREFRIAYLEKATGKKLDTKLLDIVMSCTAGHLKLMRICMEIAAEQTSKEQAALNPAFFLKQKRIQGALLEIWHALSPLEQKCVLSENPCEHEPSTYLDEVGLCKKGTITIPLFAAFLEEKKKDTLVSAQQILYHPENKTITKGDLVLSEKLTVSEFRLLRYLLENANTILEKEAIIAAVWKEAKTTAGVSDQALDQLIFRLRKKIEDDPNNPLHIQTVKGRGVKFAM